MPDLLWIISEYPSGAVYFTPDFLQIIIHKFTSDIMVRLFYLPYNSAMTKWSQPIKYQTLTRCCFQAGPASETMDQRETKIGSTSICCRGIVRYDSKHMQNWLVLWLPIITTITPAYKNLAPIFCPFVNIVNMTKSGCNTWQRGTINTVLSRIIKYQWVMTP